MELQDLLDALKDRANSPGFAAQVVKHLGGIIHYTNPASEQGGTHIDYLITEERELISDLRIVFDVAWLGEYAKSRKIDFELYSTHDKLYCARLPYHKVTFYSKHPGCALAGALVKQYNNEQEKSNGRSK